MKRFKTGDLQTAQQGQYQCGSASNGEQLAAREGTVGTGKPMLGHEATLFRQEGPLSNTSMYPKHKEYDSTNGFSSWSKGMITRADSSGQRNASESIVPQIGNTLCGHILHPPLVPACNDSKTTVTTEPMTTTIEARVTIARLQQHFQQHRPLMPAGNIYTLINDLRQAHEKRDLSDHETTRQSTHAVLTFHTAHIPVTDNNYPKAERNNEATILRSGGKEGGPPPLIVQPRPCSTACQQGKEKLSTSATNLKRPSTKQRKLAWTIVPPNGDSDLFGAQASVQLVSVEGAHAIRLGHSLGQLTFLGSALAGLIC